MAKNTSILFEQQEDKTKILINELKIGEKSKMIVDFDRNQALMNFHAKLIEERLNN